jgi:hypothetical protein
VYAVRIHFPARRGKKAKRDLVVSKPTRQAAIDYAKQVAGRGKRYHITNPVTGKHIYGASAKNPSACVYNLNDWDSKPVCFRFQWVGTKIRKAGGAVPSGLKAASVVQVPYTMLSGMRRK